MKNIKWMAIGVVFLGLIVTGYAQVNRGQNVHRFSMDVNQPVLVKGKVVEIERLSRQGYNFQGLHLMVQGKNSKTRIHLGPEFYLTNQGIELKKGQMVELNVFKGLYQGNPAYFARDLNIQGKTIVLRDGNGFPNWSRRMGRQGRGMGRGRNSRPGRGYNRGMRTGQGSGYNRLNNRFPRGQYRY